MKGIISYIRFWSILSDFEAFFGQCRSFGTLAVSRHFDMFTGWNKNRVVCYSHLKTPRSSISPPSSCSISCCPVRPFPPLVVWLLRLEIGDCDPEVPLSHRSASRASSFRHQNQVIQELKYHPERNKYLMMQWLNEHTLLPWNERNLPEIFPLTRCFFLVFFFFRYVSWGG